VLHSEEPSWNSNGKQSSLCSFLDWFDEELLSGPSNSPPTTTNDHQIDLFIKRILESSLPYEPLLDNLIQKEEKDTEFDPQNFPTGELGTTDQFSLSVSLEWTHKRGKIKPDQYWVYCEDRQASYGRITLKSPLDSEKQISKLMKRKTTNDLVVCVSDFLIEGSVPGFVICEQTHFASGTIEYFSLQDLQEIDPNLLRLEFFLREDSSLPIHPQQGRADEVKIQAENLLVPPLSPIKFASKFYFKNRAEGWFVLEMSVFYAEVLLACSQSDPFMFNNPRMKKPREYSQLSNREVKFVTLYSLSNSSSDHNDEYWLHLGLQTMQFERVLELISLANNGLDSWKRKFDEVLSPDPFTDLPLTSNYSKRNFTPVPGRMGSERMVVLYQWLADHGASLDSFVFETVHIPSSCSISLLRHEIHLREPHRNIEHLFCIRGWTVTEICDSVDLQSLLECSSVNNPPKIVLSSYSASIAPDAKLFFPANAYPLQEYPLKDYPPPVFPPVISEKEYCYTVKDVLADDIREVFIDSQTIEKLMKAICVEFQKPCSAISKLCKSTTGARLTSDKNLYHLAPSDVIFVHWQ